MNIAFLLILLTTNGNGMSSVSFVNTESEAQCKAKENMITAIFKAGNIKIDQSQCVASNLRFSKYSHNPSSTASKYFWLVDLSSKSAPLVPMQDLYSCRQAQKNQGVNQHLAICAVTDQIQLR